VYLVYANPGEGTYKCEMDGVWYSSFYVVIIFFFLNGLVGYMMEISMNHWLHMAYFLQIIHVYPLLKLYMPSCLALYIREVGIANGDSEFIYTNFLGNTFDSNALMFYEDSFGVTQSTAKYWYGFERSGYET